MANFFKSYQKRIRSWAGSAIGGLICLALGFCVITGFQDQSGNIPRVALRGSDKALDGQKAVLTQQEIHHYLLRHMGKNGKKENLISKVTHLGRLILELAWHYDFDPRLILSIIKVESNFKTKAESPQGALGLMQIMPDTGKWLALRYGMQWHGAKMLFDEECNIQMGVRYLAYLRDKYGGDLKKMLFAYNRGPAKLDERIAGGQSLGSGYYEKIQQVFPKAMRGVEL